VTKSLDPLASSPDDLAPAFYSLKNLKTMLQADPRSIRRWLKDGGVTPVVLGAGRHAALRYARAEVDAWLASRPRIS
jgi:hypothetical protein